MKVVLLKDVRDLGRAHSVQEVSDGHAINFLIPRKLALRATAITLKNAEGMQKKMGQKRELDSKLVAERLAALADGHIIITKKANEQGHLYDGVDATEIAEAAELPEEVIKLEKAIKELGVHEIPVASGEVFGKISVEITAE